MKKLVALVCVLALAGCAGDNDRQRRVFEPKLANPSAIIAAEIAFNQLAQRKGQWTAFRETLAKDATMFVPEPVDAQGWLRGRADPAVPVKWQPLKAFMSCDGKTGVTTGSWEKNGVHGYFTTVWNWFEKSPGNGEWRVIVDHGDELSAPREAPEMIETRIASCKGRAPAGVAAPAEGAKMKMGLSRDQSLSWTWVVQPDNSRTVVVQLWNGTSSDVVLTDSVAKPKT